MTTSIVTGVAGFIGSHVAEALLKRGETVIGIDQFNDYYDPTLKRKNASLLSRYPNFHLVEGDVQQLDWGAWLQEAKAVYHQAAQAGVRASWGSGFRHYTERNVNGTQALLEAAKMAPHLQRFVFASTSSIYGDAETLPTPESTCPQPVSPYGITKLAAEGLCRLYHKNFQVPVTVLRYFTVYGPRQRPDMAFHKFFKAAIAGDAIPIYGDGQQTRDFTYVGDIVAANLAAAEVPEAVGEVFNIGGGSRVVLAEVLAQIEATIGQPLRRDYREWARGDARHTGADIRKAQRLLGYAPQVSLPEGLEREWEWIQQLY